MKIDWKAWLILLIPIFFLFAVHIIRNIDFMAQSKFTLQMIFIFIFILPYLLFIISLISKKFGNSMFMLNLRQSFIIYFAIIIIVLALGKDILSLEANWLDTNLLGTGIAVLGIGCSLFLSMHQEPNTILDQVNTRLDNVDKNLVNVNKSIEKFNTNLNGIEDVVANNIIKLGDDLKKLKNSRK